MRLSALIGVFGLVLHVAAPSGAVGFVCQLAVLCAALRVQPRRMVALVHALVGLASVLPMVTVLLYPRGSLNSIPMCATSGVLLVGVYHKISMVDMKKTDAEVIDL